MRSYSIIPYLGVGCGTRRIMDNGHVGLRQEIHQDRLARVDGAHETNVGARQGGIGNGPEHVASW